MDRDLTITIPGVVRTPFSRYFLYTAFFLTGATGLVYQVLWSRLLVLSFGYTIHSVSIVITAFMGGLAAGSALGGFLADRVRKTVFFYGLAELAIGIIVLLTYPLLTGLPHFIAAYREALSIPLYGFSTWTFLITMLILVPPTFLMGLTLPLLARALTRVKESAALDIGALYSVNTMGAAIGSVVTGFFLVAFFGVHSTLAMAASVNILIGAVAVLLSFSAKGGAGAVAGEPAPPGPPGPPGSDVDTDASQAPDALAAPARASGLIGEPIFWAFGLSGFASLAVEVVWIRVFSPYLENSTYAFSLILGIFLAGIAFGGWAGRRVGARDLDSASGFAVCQVLVGVATGVGFAFLFMFIEHYFKLLPALGFMVQEPSIIVGESVWIFLILVPSTFFMGAGFPFVAQWAGRDFKSLGRRTGKLYAANTVGSILGALAGGFVLLPLLGTRLSLVFLAFLFILNGCVVIHLNRHLLSIAPKKLYALAAFLLVFVSVLLTTPDPNLLAIEHAYPNSEVFAYREDPDVNVAYLQNRKDSSNRSLYINLRIVSGSGMKLTPWMAYLPLMLYEDAPPKRLLNIGLGYGNTFVTALEYPGLEVDVVELVPSVVELFPEVNPRGKEALENPLGRIFIGDGRNYLLSADGPYDVITIDPTPPLYGTGAVNLYTSDFFKVVKEKLSPKGILLLRIPLSADLYSITLLLTTALDSFEHVSLWEPPYERKGFSVIASAHEYRVEQVDLGERVKESSLLSGSFKKFLLDTLPVFRGEGPELLRGLDFVHVVTDDRPYLEFPLFKQRLE